MADENKYVYDPGQLEIIEGKGKPEEPVSADKPAADKPADKPVEKKDVTLHIHRK